jgi:hypothetical protein
LCDNIEQIAGRNIRIDPESVSRVAATYKPARNCAGGRPKKNNEGKTSYSLALENVRTLACSWDLVLQSSLLIVWCVYLQLLDLLGPAAAKIDAHTISYKIEGVATSLLGCALRHVLTIPFGEASLIRVEGVEAITTTKVASTSDAPIGATIYVGSPHECYATVIGHLAYTTGGSCIGIGSAKLPGMAMSLAMEGPKAQAIQVLRHDDGLYDARYCLAGVFPFGLWVFRWGFGCSGFDSGCLGFDSGFLVWISGKP